MLFIGDDVHLKWTIILLYIPGKLRVKINDLVISQAPSGCGSICLTPNEGGHWYQENAHNTDNMHGNTSQISEYKILLPHQWQEIHNQCSQRHNNRFLFMSAAILASVSFCYVVYSS